MNGPVVRLQRVAAGYRNRPLWTDLTMQVGAGELVTVLGGNGTGKTTLLRILLGRHPADAGIVEVFGAPPRHGSTALGYLPQQRAFDAELPLRGIDLVRYGLDGHRWGFGRASGAARERIRGALEAVGALEHAESPIGQLSGGEQQRLRLAQALVSDPRLLLADEPFLSLDIAGQQQVGRVINERRERAGTAVLLVTHDINPVLPYTDRILYLAGARWATGTPEQVLTSETLSGLYDAPVDVLRIRDRVVIVGAADSPHHLGRPALLHAERL